MFFFLCVCVCVCMCVWVGIGVEVAVEGMSGLKAMFLVSFTSVTSCRVSHGTISRGTIFHSCLQFYSALHASLGKLCFPNKSPFGWRSFPPSMKFYKICDRVEWRFDRPTSLFVSLTIILVGIYFLAILDNRKLFCKRRLKIQILRWLWGRGNVGIKGDVSGLVYLRN